MRNLPIPRSNFSLALFLLSISALLFSAMGVCIRYASLTVDNASIVFFRNLFGLILILIIILPRHSISFFKTEKLTMHLWRALIGLAAMYGFFYAIAHMKLANAMVFTYSSPIFIPLIAWLFLKEKLTIGISVAAGIGLIGVLFIAKPDQAIFNHISLIGLSSSFFAAMAFVTVRALTDTDPPLRIVFYFCLIGTLISAIPMLHYWRPYTGFEMGLLAAVGVLASLSQLCLSKAYSLAPAGQIGPANYLAIIFAGIWGAILWHEYPDSYSLIGFILILVALILCHPYIQSFFNLSKRQSKP